MEIVTFNRRTMVTPYLALVAVVATSFATQNGWWLLLAPAIYLGWVCAAPNLNLADGCLAILCLVAGVAIGSTVWPPILRFGLAAGGMWFIGSLELALRVSLWPRGT